MGVINVTHDSFANEGRSTDPARALEAGLEMAADGAEILDVGGESTRPGAEPVSADEARARVLPVIERLAPHASRSSSPRSVSDRPSGATGGRPQP